MTICAIGQAVQTVATSACLKLNFNSPALCTTLGMASHVITEASLTYAAKEGYKVFISDRAQFLHDQDNSESTPDVVSGDSHGHSNQLHHHHDHGEHFWNYSRLGSMVSGVAGASLGAWAADKFLGNLHQHHGPCNHNHGLAETILKIGSVLGASHVAESLASHMLANATEKT